MALKLKIQHLIFKLKLLKTQYRSRFERYTFKYAGRGLWLWYPCWISGRANVNIGNNVVINAFVHIWGQGGVTIGDRTMIASHVAITSLTHDYNTLNMASGNVAASVTIGKDVWIGSHAVILPGITIGDGAVIGAGSIVTKNVPSNVIVVGNPAKFLKNRF